MEKLYWSKRNYLFKSEKYGWLLYAGLSNSFFKLSGHSIVKFGQVLI